MKVRNIEQGTIWIVEGDLKDRLLSNPNYEVVEEEKEENIEELLDEYHTGNGWYSIPDIENKLRKEDAIKALKG